MSRPPCRWPRTSFSLHSLNLNGAFRYADYNTVGGQTAWKVGGTWEPVEGLNVRVARSRDIRAPAINELYSPGSNVSNNVTLVVDGVTKNAVIPQNTSLGNPNVGPEFADTFTAGLAYRGHGALRGIGLSVDYYHIKIKDAITNLSTVNIATLCGQGQTSFCNFFTYGPDTSTADPNDRIHTGLVAGTLNVGAFEQQGFDATFNYSTSAGFLGDGGHYSFAASGTYILHALVDSGTGAAPIDRAGENGWANLGSIPTFRGNLSQTIGKQRLGAHAADDLHQQGRAGRHLQHPADQHDQRQPRPRGRLLQSVREDLRRRGQTVRVLLGGEQSARQGSATDALHHPQLPDERAILRQGRAQLQCRGARALLIRAGAHQLKLSCSPPRNRLTSSRRVQSQRCSASSHRKVSVARLMRVGGALSRGGSPSAPHSSMYQCAVAPPAPSNSARKLLKAWTATRAPRASRQL
ncbi:MAG: TonB-dependent receptor [Sphingomonas sp.]